MQKHETLSDQLETQVRILDGEKTERLSAEERKEHDLYERFVDYLIEYAIKSREALINNPLKECEDALLRDNRDLVEYFLDDHFTRKALDEIPGQVRRTLELSRLEALRIPTSVTNGYLKEATRTYLMGFPQASVALSRAALEQAIKEVLGHQGHGDFITFQDLLRQARKWGVLDDVMVRCARDVSKEGDHVMHEEPTTLENALDVLCKLRGLLNHIYSVEAG
jgi:hypothetical protein